MYVQFTNADSIACGISWFDIKTTIPTSWQPTVDPAGATPITATDGTSETSYRWITFYVPADTKAGSLSLSATVSNLTSGLKTTIPLSTTILPPPLITSIKPERGPVDTRVVLVGSGFSDGAKLSSVSIAFMGPTGYAYLWVTPQNHTQIFFNIPRTVNRYNCDGQCETPVVPGTYTLWVMANGGMSNAVNFQVTDDSHDNDTLSDTPPASSGSAGGSAGSKRSSFNPLRLLANVFETIGGVLRIR
jgi:hypothetical protein